MILHYKINRIETLQFAVFPESFDINLNVDIKTSFSFNVRQDCSRIKCVSRFEYFQTDALILILEIATYFDIAPDGAKKIMEQKSISVDFLRYMATIVVGTARGIIYAKTENTAVNRVVLPPINIVEVITEDFKIENRG